MEDKIRILVVDDDEIILSIISSQLEVLNYPFDTALDGVEALSKIHSDNYDILITDINMPLMNGIDLVRKVKQSHPGIISVIMSGPDDIAKAIDIMSGFKAFAYLIKPFDNNSLKKIIEEINDYILINYKVANFAIAEKEFYKNIQDVFDWKKEITDRRLEYITRDLIHQINIGLMHGAGFGSLVGSLSLLFSKAKPYPETSGYIVPGPVFDLIKENYNQTNDLMDGLSFAQTLIMEDEFYTDVVYPEVILNTIQKCANDLEPMLKIKNQSIKISSLPKLGKNVKLVFNQEKMKFAVTELLINAMKYSKSNIVIYVLFFFQGDVLEIKFLNPACLNSKGIIGISGKYEALVFEPFFRMEDSVDDSYSMETVKFGLGLTLVKKVMELHKGSVTIYCVNNNMKIESKIDICVSLRIPLFVE
jgi:CheY-like chemotaxis protein